MDFGEGGLIRTAWTIDFVGCLLIGFVLIIGFGGCLYTGMSVPGQLIRRLTTSVHWNWPDN